MALALITGPWLYGLDSTHSPERLEPIRMTFSHALAPSPGIPPIAIHHKADMAGQRPERKEVEQEGGREGVQAVQHRREDRMRRGHR
jgi:hypothetical protein